MRKAVKHDRFIAVLVATGLLFASAVLASAQTASAPTNAQSSQTAQGAYQPKFPGDPARSESEAQALGYMRVVLRAERDYKKLSMETAKRTVRFWQLHNRIEK